MKFLGVRSPGGVRAAEPGVARRASGVFWRDAFDPRPSTPDSRPPHCQSALRYSHIPSRPPSRPYPDSLYPPNPAAASNRLVQLIHTTPALTFGATSSARLMFSLHTLDASPYGVLFASATASSGVRKVIDTSTGPKISTCAIVDDGATFVNRVGG